jgi:hypothetical protein
MEREEAVKQRLPLTITLALAIAVPTGGATVLAQQAGHSQHTAGAFPIPAGITEEHAHLMAALAAAERAGGKTGEAAKKVSALLTPHFHSEEEFALPPLGLLRPLAEGRATPEMRDVIAMTDRLKAAMPKMLAEHKALAPALAELGVAAKAEGNAGAAGFVQELEAHATHEEEVMYPAAILVGEYLKLKLPR